MELFSHVTNGGAEYYCTKKVEGTMNEGSLVGAVLRTDGDELEIMSLSQLKKAGFKSIKYPSGKRIRL